MIQLALVVSTRNTVRFVLATVMLLGGLVVMNGTVLADALSCSNRATYIRSSHPSGGAEQDAEAYNTGCPFSTGNLEVKVMEDKTAAPDDEIAKARWRVTGNHERHAYGCDPGEGSFYGEQNLDGSKKKSDYRDFENCELR